ncbi:nuclear transport factor 2 family protein [Rhizobium sp. SGZ-381]|uniref:nuclear transport factor 2 family protein n=1 Tax=Rhizobium sp. SGZ-381 TaxID=3342800 RepID=UPI00366B7783
MILPDVLKTYFDADRTGDENALFGAFCDTAIVKDEGATHRGLPAIRSWWQGAKAKYQHAAQPLSADQNGETIEVLASVSGNFAGSPAELHFRFVLETGKIRELEIGQ